MSDPTTHHDSEVHDTDGHPDADHHATRFWAPTNAFERRHEEEIRARFKGGFLIPAQAIEAVRQQVIADLVQQETRQRQKELQSASGERRKEIEVQIVRNAQAKASA